MSTPVKDHSEGFLALASDAKKRISEISIDDYKRMREAALPHILVDVREESEWNAAHAQGAIHLSKGVIEREIEKTVPDPSSRLVLYCGGGYRSALAADNLQKMGYRNVLSLDGGWRAIEASGLPVERKSSS